MSRKTMFWPQTKIRRRGMATNKSLKMRSVVKGSLLYLFIFFLFALGYVWTRVQVVETGYRLRNLETEKEQLKEDNQSLMVEAATLRSPQRLEDVALQLGLEHPTEKQIIYVKREKTGDSQVSWQNEP